MNPLSELIRKINGVHLCRVKELTLQKEKSLHFVVITIKYSEFILYIAMVWELQIYLTEYDICYKSLSADQEKI
jgi:hypothetical protein